MVMEMQFLNRPWQTLRWDDDEVFTNSLGDCVACVMISGRTVLGYHGKGGIEAVNFGQIAKMGYDGAQTKMIVVYAPAQTQFSNLHDKVLGIIKEHNFKLIEWIYYASANAVVNRNRQVRAAEEDRKTRQWKAMGNPLPHKCKCVSQFAQWVQAKNI